MTWLDPGFSAVPRVPFDGNVRVVGEVGASEGRRAYHRAYYHAVYKPKRKAYYQLTKAANRAKKAAQARRRYAANIEEARRKARDRVRLRYQTDPEYRARVIAKAAKRRAMLKGQA